MITNCCTEGEFTQLVEAAESGVQELRVSLLKLGYNIDNREDFDIQWVIPKNILENSAFSTEHNYLLASLIHVLPNVKEQIFNVLKSTKGQTQDCKESRVDLLQDHMRYISQGLDLKNRGVTLGSVLLQKEVDLTQLRTILLNVGSYMAQMHHENHSLGFVSPHNVVLNKKDNGSTWEVKIINSKGCADYDKPDLPCGGTEEKTRVAEFYDFYGRTMKMAGHPSRAHKECMTLEASYDNSYSILYTSKKN